MLSSFSISSSICFILHISIQMADAIGKCTLELANEYCPQGLTEMLKKKFSSRSSVRKKFSSLFLQKFSYPNLFPQNEMSLPPQKKAVALLLWTLHLNLMEN